MADGTFDFDRLLETLTDRSASASKAGEPPGGRLALERIETNSVLAGAPGGAFGPADAVAAVAARVKAIAYTQPLHALESNKVRLGGEAWAGLNMLELAFLAIDAVALAMELDSGATSDQVRAEVAALAKAQVPTLEDPERVAERVLEGLISGRGTDLDGHQAAYGGWGPEGYLARRFDYALITEHHDETGEVYLRATDPAITVLMGALELDLESAEIAAELRLKELVRRGLFAEAVREAESARYRTIRFQEQLRRELSAARLGAAAKDALREVDELVDHALTHVLARYRAERVIIANVTRARDDAEDPQVVRRGTQLIERLSDCQRRHQGLQTQLVSARSRVREQLSAGLALAPRSASRIDLERQLLVPLIRLPIAQAEPAFAKAFALSSAPVGVIIANLEELAVELVAPPQSAPGLGDEVEEAEEELVEVEEACRFSEEDVREVAACLAAVGSPVRLSELLGALEGRAASGRAAQLLALHALHGLDPQAGVRDGLSRGAQVPRSGAPDGFVVAAPAGERFATAVLEGDDLVLARARPDLARADLAGSDGARADGARGNGARADLARADLARAGGARADGAGPR